MKILFTFENALPSKEADAEVFVTTARYLAPLAARAWLHVPLAHGGVVEGLEVVRAWAPAGPGLLRHLCCGLTMVLRRAFWQADLLYCRNLWIAWLAVLFGKKIVFDHYRPWPDQIPPLQFGIFRLMRSRQFLANICHSSYTEKKYLDLGVLAEKLYCVRNGFEPGRIARQMALDDAKRGIDVPPGRKTVVYTGRVNRKKGLALVVEAARRLPEILFILVGSYGEGVVEAEAADVANIRIVPWQTPEVVSRYIAAADVLLIPPSATPLAAFGSTVLPLKLFLYMASGRPILAGATPDIEEVLTHRWNAWLCQPDSVEALAEGIGALVEDEALAAALAAAALADSRGFTWEARAGRIAAIIADRLAAGRAVPQGWSRAQFGNWGRQSRRWLVHLIRTRSPILPAEALLAGKRE